ncbi:hypothetical protein JVU11DRAFT_1228 [Chiua virens]|nr:hypothetical protein JVU11DRAFT_1228 [Chiua virens]
MVYMPYISGLSLSSSAEDDTLCHKMEEMNLWVPSSVPKALLSTGDNQHLLALELHLRLAQMVDSLNEVCHHHQIIQGLYHFKKVQVASTGHKANTRTQAVISHFNNQIQLHAESYHHAYAIIEKHDPCSSWLTSFHPLYPVDIHGLAKEWEKSQGHYEPSWIWTISQHQSALDDPANIHDDVHIEWCRARARAIQWHKEVLLEKEM